METSETCKILLDKGTAQKIKCYKFFQTDFGRELAVHEHADYKTLSAITDVKTGMKLCTVDKEVKKVTPTDIDDALSIFIKHFSFDGIMQRFKELDENLIQALKK